MTPTDTIPDTTTEDIHEDHSAAQELTEQTPDAHDHSHEGHGHAGHTHPEPARTLNPELMRTIEVEASAADVDKAFRQVTKRYGKLARIPGFRAGKVPESLIKSRFGKEVRQEVLESLVSDRFRKTLEEQHIQPVSQPQISELLLFEGQPLRFKATFEVMPELNIDGYESLSVQRPDSALTEDDYQEELASILERHSTVEPVEEDRPLVDGDWAEIEFKGQIQELAQTVTEDGLEGASPAQPISGEDVLIEIGGKNTLPAFNEALRGAKAGQELTFEASYPAEFGEARLAGKTVSYDVTVKAIKRKDYPERDEEFAKQLGPYENWDDFESKLREHAGSRKKTALESQARNKMIDELVARFNFPLPETFVQQQIDGRLERGLRALAQQGMSADAMRQMDFGRLREAQRGEAMNEVKASLILDRVAERENIAVADADLERELLMLSIQSREPYDALRKRITEDGSIERIREQMRREKTASALFERLAS